MTSECYIVKTIICKANIYMAFMAPTACLLDLKDRACSNAAVIGLTLILKSLKREYWSTKHCCLSTKLFTD